MIQTIKEIYSAKDLLWIWTRREIMIRYKQSILGVVWAILQPLALMIIFNVVFSFFIRVPTDGIPYPIFSYTALLPWTFFSTSLSFATSSLAGNMSLITKIYFPRLVLPLASIFAAFFDFLIASTVFIGLMIWYKIPLTWNLLWIPVIILIQVILTIGIVMPASAMNVFYRDIRFVVPLVLQLWLYATPIIYPMSAIPERYRWILPFNPMTGIIESYRLTILQGQQPNFLHLGTSMLISLIFLTVGFVYFKRVEFQFADLI